MEAGELDIKGGGAVGIGGAAPEFTSWVTAILLSSLSHRSPTQRASGNFLRTLSTRSSQSILIISEIKTGLRHLLFNSSILQKLFFLIC